MKTMIALDLTNNLEKYKNVFDLDKYHAQRAAFLDRIVKANDPEDILAKEILMFGKKHRLDFMKEKKSSNLFRFFQ